jgi:hypothetical protein
MALGSFKVLRLGIIRCMGYDTMGIWFFPACMVFRGG